LWFRSGGFELLLRWLLLLPLTAVSVAQVMTVPSPQTQAGSSSSAAQIDAAARDKVAADLRANKLDDALAGAQAILASHPASAQANKLVGVVLLAQQKAGEALPYFQKALALDANDPTIHALLLQAYAQSGDAKNRDVERAILRGYHNDGQHPEFARAPSFQIETIPFQGKVVQALEFYEPQGRFHFYYRFNVFDQGGRLMYFYALESDDADQAMFAQQHPKEAAAGERRFSIDVYAINAKGNPTQGLVTFLDGQPTYDDLRARIIHILDAGGQSAAAPAAPSAP
jgi:tetratricopeptide (TPR) repeat protein